MNIRSILVALVVLAGIALIYYTVLNREQPQTNIETAEVGQRFFPNLKLEDIYKFSLSMKDDEVVVEKDENDQWVVRTFHDYKARMSAVDRLLPAMVGLKKGKPVSSNPENFPKYEAGEDKGVTVKLFDTFGKQLGAIIIGKASSHEFDSTYSRLPGIDKVLMAHTASEQMGISFMTQVEIRPEKKINHKNWAEQQVTNYYEGYLRKIELITPESKIVFNRIKEEIEVPPSGEDIGDTEAPRSEVEAKWKWIVTEPEEFEPTKESIKMLQRFVSRIYAADIVGGKDIAEYGLDNPQRKIVFDVLDKQWTPDVGMEIEPAEPVGIKTVEVLFGNKAEEREIEQERARGKENYYMKRSDGREIFIASDYTTDSIFKNIDDFKPKPEQQKPQPAPPPPVATTPDTETAETEIDTASIIAPAPRQLVPAQPGE